MQSGRLRHRVKIQKRLTPQNEVGEAEIRFVDWENAWASVEPLTGRELFAAQQIQSQVNTRIRIRFLAGVTELMRVVHTVDIANDIIETYDIEAVLQDSRSGRREMQLLCIKRGADGNRSNGT